MTDIHTKRGNLDTETPQKANTIAGTLISEKPPELGNDKFRLFEPLSLWCFVTGAVGN